MCEGTQKGRPAPFLPLAGLHPFKRRPIVALLQPITDAICAYEGRLENKLLILLSVKGSILVILWGI